MNVKGLVWLGIDTSRYRETVEFLHEVLGLTVTFESGDSVEFECPNGTRVQVTRAASDSCPVPLFEVDDLSAALQEFRAAGTLVVSEIREDEAWRWIEVLDPAGHRYEFAARK
jgi:predicted enzyme related to lactoylglutathione lyase